jgi:hypothetical protein
MVEGGMKTAYDKLTERAERRTQVKPVGTRP